MSEVKRHQPDREEWTSEKADELADKRYGREFASLPSSLQMQVWMEAEQEATDYFIGLAYHLATEADAMYDREREDNLTAMEDGQKTAVELEALSADLELSRRLGK